MITIKSTYYDLKSMVVLLYSGRDSKAGTIAHEISHYESVGRTKGHVYGEQGAKALAKKDPSKAIENADSFQYFIEGDGNDSGNK